MLWMQQGWLDRLVFVHYAKKTKDMADTARDAPADSARRRRGRAGFLGRLAYARGAVDMGTEDARTWACPRGSVAGSAWWCGRSGRGAHPRVAIQ